MMSSPETERFEITDNDLEQIFEPGTSRRRQSKQQATYGIWADPDSEEEGHRPGFGGGRSRKNDYATPISFISGGYKQPAAAQDQQSDETVSEVSSHSHEKTGKKRGRKEEMRFLQKHPQTRDFGQWEKHTKGIGQKLLQKMGYVPGEGLGKKGQGITTPVEAVKRKGRGAIGAHGTERSERSLKDFPVADSDEEAEQSFQEELQQWRKAPENKAQKPKYVYKTAQEVIDSGGKKKTLSGSGPKVKVIDMTGKEKRILSGYHAIGRVHDRPDEGEEVVSETLVQGTQKVFQMPELVHNLNLLVDMTEEDIVVNERRLRHDEDRLVNLSFEEERLENMCKQESQLIEKLTALLDIVKRCEARMHTSDEDRLTLDECVVMFKHLRDEFYAEYKLYDIPALAIAIVFPLMKEFLSKWNVLQDPSYGVMTMLEWRILLEEGESPVSHTGADMDPYQRLLWDVWLPPVRATILKWNARDYQPLIAMLEAWRAAIPPWILDNILDQLVLPRLLQEVENWNPLTDTVPIHSWLHPWLPLMGDRLEPLYAPIRHKLASALTSWHPSDTSAKIILEPWVGVFRQGHMDAFLVKNVLPKLEQVLDEMPISPHQQTLDPLRWVMAWKEIMPLTSLASILDKAFFPKWIQVLIAWLSNMPNYSEITRWYLGWKAQFPDKLLQHPTVRDQLTKALDIMNQAASGHFLPGMKENIAYFTHTERQQMDIQPKYPHPAQAASISSQGGPEPSLRSAASLSSAPLKFKDLVEKRAEEANILFMPMAGKTHEGHQVYRFGNMQVYIDRSVLFMQDHSDQWIPVSLQTLIDRT